MSNSRSWQRLCVLCAEILSSLRPGKAIGSFESRTKDFLPSGPREGEKRGAFLCLERVARSTGGILSWLFGRQDVSLGRPRVYFGKAKLQVSHLQHTDVPHLLLLLLLLFCAFPARVLPALLVALSPALGHNVTAKLLAQEGEAGGCFPLPSLIVELPSRKTLASSVSHTSAHPSPSLSFQRALWEAKTPAL